MRKLGPRLVRKACRNWRWRKNLPTGAGHFLPRSDAIVPRTKVLQCRFELLCEEDSSRERESCVFDCRPVKRAQPALQLKPLGW